MVTFGQLSIVEGRQPGTAGGALGLHVMRLTDLYAHRGEGEHSARYRVPVHLLALVTTGRASFTVDFETIPCRPGGLLWVRPGQFVGFPPPGIDATLILFDEPESEPTPGSYWQPAGEDGEAILNAVSQLEIDYARLATGEKIPAGVLRHQLTSLLLRLAEIAPEGRGGPTTTEAEILRRFRREINLRFAVTRQVDDYAQSLNCSVRTLTRAALAATGRTAKQLLDDRVALEAKRLLAESDLSVAAVGARLGFPEPTNFGRFFARTVGSSPGQFRAESRRAAAEAEHAPTTTPPAQPLVAALAKAGSLAPPRL